MLVMVSRVLEHSMFCEAVGNSVFPLEKEVATCSKTLAWEIPWTEGPWQAIVHGVTKESDMT